MPILNCFSQLSYAEAGKKTFWAKYWLSRATWEASSRSFEEEHFVVLLQHVWTVFNLADQYKPLLLLFFFVKLLFSLWTAATQMSTAYNSLHWTIASVEKWLICPVWYVYAGLQSNFLSCWVWPVLWPSVYCGLLTWVSLILFWVLAHWRTSPCWLEKINKKK